MPDNIVDCCKVDKHSAYLLFCRETALNFLCKKGDTWSTVDLSRRKPACS